MINGVSGRDLLQVALFLAILLVTAQPLGRYIARVLAGERTFLTPGAGPPGAGDLPPVRDRPRGRPALDGLRRLAPAVQPARAPADLPDLQDPAVAALERPGLRPPLGRPGLQHRGQLHHQHQLAGLQRGEHRLQLHPDGGPGGAQLHLRRHRDRRRRRPGPRAGPAQRQRDRQLLDRRGARHPLPAAAPLPPRGPRPDLAGRPPDAGRDGRGDDARRRAADPHLRADGEPGGDQGAGHQRRGLPQRQLGPPLRGPDPAGHVRPDRQHLPHPFGAGPHLRLHRGRRAPGLGRLGGDGHPVPARASRWPSSPSSRATPSWPGWASTSWCRAGAWRARRCASASCSRCCSPW